MDLNFIRKNLRSFLGIPDSMAPGITASLPTVTASLPVAMGGTSPEMQLVRPGPAQPVASAAPVATRPTVRTVATPAMHDAFKLYEEQIRLDFDLESKLALAQTPDASRQIRAAFMQYRASKLRGKTIGDIAKTPFALRPTSKAAPAPAPEDDNQTATPTPTPDPEQDPSLDSIISQLCDLVLQLKKTVQVSGDDDAEVNAALGHFAAGRKLTASRQLMALTQRLCLRPRLTASQKISRGFSAQSGVQAIQNCLHGKSAARASYALAPVAGGPAQSAVASPSDRLAKIAALKAERDSLEAAMRKTYIFDAKSLARQGQIRAELHSLKAR